MRIVTFMILFQMGAPFLLAQQKQNKDSIVQLSRANMVFDGKIKPGAWRLQEYLPFIKEKKVGLVANHSSLVGKTHLADTLLKSGIQVVRVFAPEHGFRGMGDAGEKISNATDSKTGLKIISLYGSHLKPTREDLKDINYLVFDIQDVGARFYTYISTLHYVMEAAAENNIPLMVLDRPNPNGFYIDGPVLNPKYASFVGMHPVPVVHGMTIGEYAMMINGEKWLKDSLQCQLKVVRVEGYAHSDYYQLPVPPSPNLKTMPSIYLYPSLCFFEGTPVSVGRGTDKPFCVFGYPGAPVGNYKFTPKSVPGASNPPHLGKECTGMDVSGFGESYIKTSRSLYLFWLIGMYENYPRKDQFFTPFFLQLAGTPELEKQIKSGMTEDQIRKTWEPGLKSFKTIRKKYLLYSDFKD